MLDANLATAATDLDRLDAEIRALSAKHPGKDLHEIRGVRTREAQRDRALRTLCRTPARTTAGLDAKARALRTPELIADVVRHSALAESLAEDRGRLNPAGEPANAMIDPPSREERQGGSSGEASEPAPPYDDAWEAKAVRAAAAAALADHDLSTPVTDELRVAIAHHRDARLTFLADTDLSDAATDRSVHRIDEAEATLRAVPSRTPADLRAKIVYQTRQRLADPDNTNDPAFLQHIIDEADQLARRPIRLDTQACLAAEAREQGACDDRRYATALHGDAIDPIDPIFAVIATSRRANEAFARGHLHDSAGTPAGEAEMQRLCAAKDRAWAALLAVRPTTPAGGGALAAHAADWISVSPDLGSAEIVTVLRAIGAGGTGHARSEATDRAPWVIPGFVEYPRGQGFMFAIDVVLAQEARRLLKIARDEYDRKIAEWGDGKNFPPGILERHIRSLRRDLRLDALFEAAGELGAEGTAGVTSPDPAFAAMTAHRAAHIAWQAALKDGDLAASDAALERKNAAFEALLRTVPTTEAGRAAATRHVLFEFVHVALDGGVAVSKDWAREAGRLLNGGLPVFEDTPPPPAVEPVAAEAALRAAIDAHERAYAHRLHSMVAGEADANERAEQERKAFRALLHVPLGSDWARAAYARAVIGPACGAYASECDGVDRSSPLPTAYRNLAYGDHAPEPAGSVLLAAE